MAEIPMVEAFRRRVSEQPGAPALTVADLTLTFEALDERTDRLARRLVAPGAGPGPPPPRRSTVLIPGPLHHTAPFAMALLALLHGNHLVVEPRFDAATTLADLGRYRAEFVLLVPTMMHRIWRLPAETRQI